MATAIFAIILGLLILIVAIVGTIFIVIYWRLIQRPVPKLDGDVVFTELDAPVEILRDKHAIPHVYAQSRADLFRAQGYLHAQDRMWQMEQNRRVARGTLSEVYGEPALDADRFSRVIGFWRAAQAELEILDGESRKILDWYAEGVNAYIRERPNTLAAEYNLLRVEPDPWSALDTLGFSKVMAWSLSVNWESELTRLRLALQLGPERSAELEADYPKGAATIFDHLEDEETMRMLSTTGLLLNQYEELQSWLREHGISFGVGQGSNSWVLSPKASMSGHPLLANDPHLGLTMPGTWYECHLSCPDLEVSGASFAGSPGVIIGHNEQIAWGITNAFVDVQDLYIERAHPNYEDTFAFGDEWEEAEVLEEEIFIRKQDAPHIERVVITRHGPLINRLIEGMLGNDSAAGAAANKQLPIALRWTGHIARPPLLSLLRLNEASNWDQFEEALMQWAGPPSNFVYADNQGYIGYLLAGDVPKRDGNPGLLPAPGWTGQHEWDGLIPREELPRSYNPPSGMIVTANNKIVGDDFPHFMGIEYVPGWRAARIQEILETKERHTLRDMQEMQIDVFSKVAQTLTPWIASTVEARNTYESVALTALREWNYRMDVESIAPTTFHYVLLHLVKMTFGDKVRSLMPAYAGVAGNPLFNINSFVFRPETRLLELIEQDAQSIWYMEAKTGRSRTREELLQEAFRTAIQYMRDEMGESPVRWQWGRHHQVRYVHPLGSVRLLKTFFNRGPYPIGGDGTTVMQTRHAAMIPLELVQVVPSYRQIYEVGQWDKALSVTTNGQSGHPLSDHYDDQIAMWREGEYHAMPWTKEAVNELTVYRMTLLPDD